MSFYNGILNLTNWTGNVILPTLAAVFFIVSILRFSRGQSYYQAMYGGLFCLLGSGLVRALETFASQRAWNDPNVYWISIVTLVNWVANVIMPLFAALEVVAGGVTLATDIRVHYSSSWQRHFLTAGLCLLISGLLRLAEFFVSHGVGGVT